MPKPMTAADVSRLLGRVAFGATAADLDTWTGREYGDLVDALVTSSVQLGPAPLPDEPERLSLEKDLSDRSFARATPARKWWLERMRTTPYPLLERMTLFWHGHFATAVSAPPFVFNLMRQNQTFRRNALGSFRTMCEEITVDPAMLYWLSGFQNAVPNPNENYAREFFELFTLGKRPQVYSEKDIREAARAFTGWYVDPTTEDPIFALSRHDKGTKRVLGRAITNQGEKEYVALVDVALDQPVSYRFIGWKLVANFCYVPSTRDLLRKPDPLVNKIADAMKKNDWSLAAGVRAMLLADEFRYAAPGHSRQHVRQPVECVVHAAKVFGVPASDNSLVAALQMMGQSLFNPVNVGGWPLGRDWVTPVSAIGRYDAGLHVHRLAADSAGQALFPAPDDLAGWAKRLGLGGLTTNTTNAINGYLRRTANTSVADRQAGVLTLLLSSPEWSVM